MSEALRRAHAVLRRVESAAVWPVGLLALLLLVPIGLDWVPAWTLLIPVGATVIAYALSRVEDAHGRRRFLQLWALGLAVRWCAFILLVLAQRHVGAALLGPDAVQYLGRSVQLAAAGLWLPESPITYYGTYDVGPYYLFATLIAVFGDNLLTLQMVNASFGALIAPLTYSWVRLLTPARASIVGLVLAVYPTATVLAVVDLLKDPAVILVTVLAVWAVAHLAHGAVKSRTAIALTLIAAAALAFLHVTRFYTLFFLGFGAIVAAVTHRATAGRWPLSREAAACVATAFLAAELLVMPFGWPVSAHQVWTIGQGVLGTVEDGAAATPVLDRRQVKGRESSFSEIASSLRFAEGPGRGDVSTGRVEPLQDFDEGPAASKGRVLQVETDEYRALQPGGNFQGRVTSIVRKTLGPYIWILPSDVSVRTLLAGDYLHYPGMMFWYALWPLMIVGLARAGWDVAAARSPFILSTVTIFTAGYLAMYLLVNLSYRQRDAAFPFLLVFAVLGAESFRRSRWLVWGYGTYWVGLVLLAAAHLVARSRLA